MEAYEIALIIAAAVFGVALIVLGALYWIYSFAFRRSRVDCDKYSGLDSEAMAPFREENRKSITYLSELEYEAV